MSINQDFYGLEADWITVSNARYDVKKAAWTDSATAAAAYGSLDTLVRSPIYNPENMATVPLDSSIIPWKVNENSKVFRRKYCELSFPNQGGSDPPAIADYFDQSANYRESENFAIKNVNGFRFFAAYYTVNDNNFQYSENAWVRRYSPYNYKNEFLDGTSGTAPYKNIFPIVSFDYSRTIATVEAALIPKINLDDSASISSDSSINKYYNNRTPDYQATYKDLATLTDGDLTTNYLVGFLFKVFSGGYSSSYGGISLTLIPIDDHSAVPAAQWGGTTGQGYPYQTDFTCYTSWIASSSDRVRYCQLGGATSFVNPANCGRDGSEPATYDAQYYETKGMRTMNTEDFEGEGLEVGSWTITTNTGSGTIPNGRVNSWFIPKCYNNLTVAQIRTAIFKELAYLGFWFTDDIYYAQYVDMTNHPEKYYLPEINSAGVTTGNYKAYSEASEEINFEWNTDIYNKTPYDPANDQGDDPNVYDDNTTILNPNGTNIYQKFSTRYIINQAQLASVAGLLFTKISTDTDSDWWSSKTFYVNNPLDVITQLTFYPLDLSLYQDDVYRADIMLGSFDTEINALLNRKQNIIVDMGSCVYYPIYGVKDFRSYPPYSSAQLVIPYCGSVDIDPNLYLNHRITVKLIIDTASGSCLALIYRDSMVTDTLGGQIGINVPLSGIQSQSLAASERQAQSSLKMARIGSITQFAQAAASIAGGLVMGGTGGAAAAAALQFTVGSGAKAVETLENAEFNLEHINVPFKQVGTATASTSWAMERRCRLIIKRPMMLDTYTPEAYAHSIGYSTYDTNTLGSYSGYTVCSAANTDGIAATDSERSLIKEFLLNGVIL